MTIAMARRRHGDNREPVDPIRAAVSELGNASRFGDDERRHRARQRLAVARVEREINAAMNGAHPITDDQRAYLARLLQVGGA